MMHGHMHQILKSGAGEGWVIRWTERV